MSQIVETYIIDSFTNELFKGNPAGVCLLEENLSEWQMLSIAKELGLSETAFVVPSEETYKYSIRYFSPKMEIPLCGHATLASAKALFEKHQKIDQIHFTTVEHLDLIIRNAGQLIEMEFPVFETENMSAPRALLSALGLEEINNSVFNKETNMLLLEIDDCNVLRNLKPDFTALIESHDGINGVLVTALSNQENFDFESRYFWPWSGTNEDPVTGSTHSFLTKYWSDRLNRKKMQSFQCSERTGFMEVELIADNKLAIRSTARIVLKGNLILDLN